MSKKRDSINHRISELVLGNWITAMYFTMGINELKEKFDAMSDEELRKYTGGLIAPELAREHLDIIFNNLNDIK